ncbi:MAG: hypothetical protein GC145_14395 [Caulobacter sp.]|nr:hypothetical protein [Caulobacter sp.]
MAARLRFRPARVPYRRAGQVFTSTVDWLEFIPAEGDGETIDRLVGDLSLAAQCSVDDGATWEELPADLRASAAALVNGGHYDGGPIPPALEVFDFGGPVVEGGVNLVLDAARAEADRLLEEARSQATELVNGGAAEGARLVDEGKAEAQRLIDAGTAEAARLVDEGKAKAQGLVDAATAKAKPEPKPKAAKAAPAGGGGGS